VTRSPFAINVREAPAYVVPVSELVTLLAGAEQTGGAFGLMEGLLTRGADPPPHVHHREDESFFVLEGALSVRVGDDSFSATSGSFVFCPRDVPHVLTVETEQVRLLTFITPGGLEPFFVELGEPAPERTLPARPPEPDVERIVTLAGHYGVEVLPNWP
jgi:mannose-6-phosphate isomerase-like protein (cupin superfamily)